jgi:hypothetical protein
MWFYIRLAIVAAAFLGGILGQGRDLNTGYTAAQLAMATFAFGVFAMQFVIGIQAFNARSAPVWRYPSWRANPFTMREPLQFFHLGGYYFLASGVGGLLHVAVDGSLPVTEPIMFASTGAGVICGVWLCCRLFRRKMART